MAHDAGSGVDRRGAHRRSPVSHRRGSSRSDRRRAPGPAPDPLRPPARDRTRRAAAARRLGTRHPGCSRLARTVHRRGQARAEAAARRAGDSAPPPLPGAVPKPLPVVRATRLALGTRVPLDMARAKLGFRPVLPRGLGTPTVYYDPFTPGGQLGLVYPHGIVVTQLEGHLTRFVVKFIPPGTSLERLTIEGNRALWIHGALHQYVYADRT